MFKRKFVVKNLPPSDILGPGTKIQVGFLKRNSPTIRVQLDESTAILTIKSEEAARSRLEYPLTSPDAHVMLALCQDGRLEKTRYNPKVGNFAVVINVFGGKLTGLAIAEVSLPFESSPIPSIDWLGEEVTYNRNYTNVALSLLPSADAIYR